MNRSIGSVAVWPVFVVLFKLSFGKILIRFRGAGDAAWPPLGFVFVFFNCWWKRWIPALTRKLSPGESEKDGTTAQQDFCWRRLSLCGTLLFIWFFFSSVLFILLLNYFFFWGGWYSTNGHAIWIMGEKVTGVRMSMVITPLALRIALQPQFVCFPPFISIHGALANHRVREREKHKTPAFWIFISQSFREHKRWGKEVNLFWLSYFAPLLVLFFSSFLILKVVYFIGSCFVFVVFVFGRGWGLG